MGRKILFLAVVSFLILVGFLPIFSMIVRTIWVNGRFSILFYKDLLLSVKTWKLLWHSFLLSFITTFLTTIVGVPLGIIFSRTDLPLRRFFVISFTIPLLIPPYIVAVSWFNILGRNGVISMIFGKWVGNVTSNLLFGLPGCVLVLFSTFLPIVILLSMAHLRGIDPKLEESGRLVTGWLGVLRKITIPLILPGILFASVLVFLFTFGELGVPLFLRYDVFPVESFTQFSAFYNFEYATAASVPFVVITFFVLLIEKKIQKNGLSIHFLPTSYFREYNVIKLHSHKTWIFLLIVFLSLVIVFIPFIVLFFRSLPLDIYREALLRVGDSLFRSFWYSFLGATILTLVGLFTGALIHMDFFGLSSFLDSFTVYVFALPGTVIGIGLIDLWNHRLTNFIYGTFLIIILGYVAKYVVLTSRITVSSLSRIPQEVEDAARIVGAKWFKRFVMIDLPLIKRGILMGWLVGFIFCLRDVGITMLVYPPGKDTLSVRIFTLMANGSYEMISALCVIMVFSVILSIFMGTILLKFVRSDL